MKGSRSLFQSTVLVLEWRTWGTAPKTCRDRRYAAEIPTGYSRIRDVAKTFADCISLKDIDI